MTDPSRERAERLLLSLAPELTALLDAVREEERDSLSEREAEVYQEGKEEGLRRAAEIVRGMPLSVSQLTEACKAKDKPCAVARACQIIMVQIEKEIGE